MITLQEFVEAINFRITGGSEYQWKCFGDNARCLDCEGEILNEFSVHAVFDSKDQTVYSVEAWDYINDRAYRWIHPNYIKAYKKSCKKYNVDFENACDTMNFIDIEVESDMLEKVSAIIAGDEYDTRVQVPLTLDDDQLFDLMKMAHQKDLTLNELVEDMLRTVIKEREE